MSTLVEELEQAASLIETTTYLLETAARLRQRAAWVRELVADCEGLSATYALDRLTGPAIPVAAPSPETGTAAVPRHVCYCKGTCKFKAGPAPEPVKPRSFDDDGERDEYPPVHLVQLRICQACLDGTGSECHTPGCALWLHSVDLPIHRELYEIIEPARTPAAGTAPKGER